MNDDQPSALVWFRSPVFVNLLVSGVMQILAVSHVSTTLVEADVAKIVDLVLQIAAICFGAYAAWKRKSSTIQPLTLTTQGAASAVANASEPTIPTTELPK